MVPTARVVRRLPPSTRITTPPLVVRRGETVQVGERSDEWPAFVFITTSHRQRGWIPSRILRREGTSGHVRKGYDTTTLDPRVGEELEVITEDVEGGWLWCRDARSRVGWFPKNHLDIGEP